MVAPHLGGLRSELGVDLGLPARHCLGVLLVGAVQRPLGRQPELPQQPPHAHLRQPHSELPTDQFADHRAGPQRKGELQLPWIIADHQGVDPLQLGAGQRRRPSGDGPGLEGLQPALAVLGQPAIHRGSGHPHCRGDVLGMGALFDAADCAHAQLL